MNRLFFVACLSLSIFIPMQAYADIDRACFDNWCSGCLGSNGFGVDECYIENANQMTTSDASRYVNAKIHFDLNINGSFNGNFIAEINHDDVSVGLENEIYLDGKRTDYSGLTMFSESVEIVKIARAFKDSENLMICFDALNDTDCVNYSLRGFKEASHYWLGLVEKYLAN